MLLRDISKIISVLALCAAVALGFAQTQTGTPPEILDISFPATIQADGEEYIGRILFKDEDGDAERAELTITEAEDPQSITINGQAPEDNVVSLEIASPPEQQQKGKGVILPRVATTTPQEVKIKVVLVDEAGNESEPEKFSFTARGNLPDLVVSLVTLPSEVHVGQEIEVSYTIENIGGGDAGPFRVGVYLSRNADVTPDDLLLSSQEISELASDASAAQRLRVKLAQELMSQGGLEPGSLFLGVIADDSEQVEESDETNNMASSSIRVKRPESWDKTFGGSKDDEGSSVQHTTDGGYILSGTTQSYGAGNRDLWLIKTDANGNKYWSKTFGGTYDEEALSAKQTMDGGYILLGNFFEAWLIKTDAYGNKQWDRTFGDPLAGDNLSSVQQTKDGGYILLGTKSYRGDEIVHDLWLIKIDTQGNDEWDRAFDRGVHDRGFSIWQTEDGGYILLGESDGVPWLIKTDAHGNKEWDKTFHGDHEGLFVQQTEDGGYILVGTYFHYSELQVDFWLMKTNAQGNKQWEATFGGEKDDWVGSVQQAKGGGYILLGSTESYGTGGYDIWLIKTDAQGNKQWDKTFGGREDDRGSSVQQAKGGGYILLGTTESHGVGEKDIWLIKYYPEE